MEVSPFYKAPKQLFRSCGFVRKSDRMVIDLMITTKVVLMYMIDRVGFFSVEGGEHFETQATIGDACGIDRRSAARALKLLVDNGVISAVKQRRLALSPHSQWYYKGVDLDIELVERIGEHLVSMDTGLIVETPDAPDANDRGVRQDVKRSEVNDYSDDFLNSVDFGENE